MRDLEVVVTYNFDAIMNALHREALGVLLPYDTHWEKRSWWYSQYCVIMLCAAFYNQHRLQVNAVRVLNRETGSYVQREKEWECALVWLLPAFERKDAIARIPLDDPISHAPKLIELMNPNGSPARGARGAVLREKRAAQRAVWISEFRSHHYLPYAHLHRVW